MFLRLLNSKLLSRNLTINQRCIFTSPSPVSANKILDDSKKRYQNSLKSYLSVDKDTDCLKCYKIMKENNLDYLKVTDGPKIIGVLNISDVRNKKLWYEYESEEHDKMLRDLPKL